MHLKDISFSYYGSENPVFSVDHYSKKPFWGVVFWLLVCVFVYVGTVGEWVYVNVYLAA